MSSSGAMRAEMPPMSFERTANVIVIRVMNFDSPVFFLGKRNLQKIAEQVEYTLLKCTTPQKVI